MAKPHRRSEGDVLLSVSRSKSFEVSILLSAHLILNISEFHGGVGDCDSGRVIGGRHAQQLQYRTVDW